MSNDYIAISGPSKHDRTSGQRARKRTTANIDFRGAVRASGAIAVGVGVGVAVGVAVSDSVAVDFQGRACCERVKGWSRRGGVAALAIPFNGNNKKSGSI